MLLLLENFFERVEKVIIHVMCNFIFGTENVNLLRQHHTSSASLKTATIKLLLQNHDLSPKPKKTRRNLAQSILSICYVQLQKQHTHTTIHFFCCQLQIDRKIQTHNNTKNELNVDSTNLWWNCIIWACVLALRIS